MLAAACLANAKERIKELCEEFKATKTNLVKTYGKTRFMQVPDGFIADQNHHKHLAALSPGPDWLFLYEDAFVKALEEIDL